MIETAAVKADQSKSKLPKKSINQDIYCRELDAVNMNKVHFMCSIAVPKGVLGQPSIIVNLNVKLIPIRITSGLT